jgi:mRNA-degrading endonuclease RelE of RelBE toxin-antitoxin system
MSNPVGDYRVIYTIDDGRQLLTSSSFDIEVKLTNKSTHVQNTV